MSDQGQPELSPEQMQQMMMQPTAFDKAVQKQNNLLGNLNFRATLLEEEKAELQAKLAKAEEKIAQLEAELAPFLGHESEPEENAPKAVKETTEPREGTAA